MIGACAVNLLLAEVINDVAGRYQGQSGRLGYRAGYSFGGNPVSGDQVLPAIFAPTLTDAHASTGLSWALSPEISLNWALIYSVANRITGRNALSNVTPVVGGSGSAVGFVVVQDANDQRVDAYLSVWQSQFGITWAF